MKDLKSYIKESMIVNEGQAHDIKKAIDEIVKKYNKPTALDKLIADVKKEFSFEYDKSASEEADTALYFWANYSNNAEEDDVLVSFIIDRDGNKVTVVDGKIVEK
jgi:stage III sporulation protein SpoIIIAA